jgi:ATP-dependent DNA helicase DinG
VTGIREYQGYLERLLNSEQHEWVKWLEIHSSGWFALKVAPCNIGKYMKDQLYGRYDRVVFTSATLAVDGEFDFVEDRLGLADVPAENKRLRVFGSSFDFTSQVEFTCAAFLPSPKSEMYQSRLAGFLKKLLRDIRLSTLILFTSYRSLQQTASELEGSVQNLVVQKGTGTADSATREFVRLKPAVLLGTESFWQGVDLPGDLLEMLIITRLPFAVPGEPIDSARMEEIEKRGINSFAAYSLPQAVIRFKQGFGRLIRTSHDTGSIIVTDNRLVKSTFGQVFLNSVPAQIGISSSFEELRDKVLRRSSMVI